MIIVDIDNCISEDNWRVKYINSYYDNNNLFDKFHKYHSLSAFDISHQFPQYAEHILNNETIVFVTSRPEFYRFTTEYWLDVNGYEYDYLFMRQKGCDLSSADYKSRLVRWIKADFREEITMCYDDRIDVLESYRKLGLKTTRIAIHDTVQAKYQP